MQSLQTQFWLIRDALAPVLRTSQFKEHGRITPEEFVAAGDYLVYKFPTWSWEKGDEGKTRDFLPKDKQYLISRNVPCLRRVSQMIYTDADEDAETMMSFAAEGAVKDEDDWVTTHTNRESEGSSQPIREIKDIPDLDHSFPTADADVSSAMAHLSMDNSKAVEDEAIPDMDDIPEIDDMEEFEDGGVREEEDQATLKRSAEEGMKAISSASDNLLQVRTYNCFITYDKYYQTPRFWLMGYDENKTILPPAQIFSDISPDYAQKTVTIEPFPHLNNISMASVHPCKHANVMKKVIERMNVSVIEAQRREMGLEPASTDKKKSGKGWGAGVVKKMTGKTGDKKDPAAEEPEGLRVDQYLIVFLKFISSVTPTIEVDATTSM
ncbi:hypothetical protein BT69DRAFT_1252180 [Atractiella rhizophila]|nr:hypothetical protein BT69DRAFT_1252180 [Atractiella rhizophila]